jgi:ribonuclease HI
MSMKKIEIYSDGACEGNPGPGGYAAIIDEDDAPRREVVGAERDTTNNRMELMAVIRALESLSERSQVRVSSDSQYVVRGMTEWIHSWKRKGWKTASKQSVKNRDLWERLDVLTRHHEVSWEWVRGHSGHPENEEVDALAKEAIAHMLAEEDY